MENLIDLISNFESEPEKYFRPSDVIDLKVWTSIILQKHTESNYGQIGKNKQKTSITLGMEMKVVPISLSGKLLCLWQTAKN